MPKGYHEILKDVKSNTYAPIYWLQGEEPFFIDSIGDYIEQHALDESLKGFNQTVLYGKENKIIDILNHARQFPMMAERRVVLVKEAQDIADLNREEGEKALTAYLEKPNISTVLVFCYKYKTIDARKKLAKELEKACVVLAEKKIYDNKVPEWIKVFASDLQLKLSEKAVYMLSEHIGNNLERIHNELKKVKVNLPGDTVVDEHHIQRFVGISKDFNEFELQKAIGMKDHKKAFQIVQYFGANTKSHPVIPLLVILFTYFTKLLLLHKNNQASDDELARKIGVSPFFVKEYKVAARNYSAMMVIRNIHLLKNADLQVKGVTSNSISEEDLMKELVYKLMH
jgi:DNA polymerase III subunit delta